MSKSSMIFIFPKTVLEFAAYSVSYSGCRLKQELALCQTELSSQREKLEKLESAYEDREKLKEEVERMSSLNACMLMIVIEAFI